MQAHHWDACSKGLCIPVLESGHGAILLDGSGPGKLSFAADEQSVWTILRAAKETSGHIVRFAVASAAVSFTTASPLATVTGVDTACELAVHPTTDELWVVERKTQAILRFPSNGGGSGDGDGAGAPSAAATAAEVT